MAFSKSTFLVADGRELARQMFLEIREDCDNCTVDPEDRAPGIPQNVIVARYLAVLRKHADAALDQGFAELLTDLIAVAESEGVATDARYERLLASVK